MCFFSSQILCFLALSYCDMMTFEQQMQSWYVGLLVVLFIWKACTSQLKSRCCIYEVFCHDQFLKNIIPCHEINRHLGKYQLFPTPANTNLSQMGRYFSFPLFTCKMSLLVLRITEREGSKPHCILRSHLLHKPCIIFPGSQSESLARQH